MPTDQAVDAQTGAYHPATAGWARAKRLIAKHWQFYLFITPAVLYIIVFKYIPMAGAQIAFRDYSPRQGIWGSEWIGLTEFARFVSSPYFWILIRNTLSISLLALTIGFVSPIILALALNEVRTGVFKKTVQTVTYAPHFISTVVMAAMIIEPLAKLWER